MCVVPSDSDGKARHTYHHKRPQIRPVMTPHVDLLHYQYRGNYIATINKGTFYTKCKL